jgi:hypothetical protein
MNQQLQQEAPMPMMHPSAKYLRCNSDAIDKLQQGNAHEASQILRLALSHLQTELAAMRKVNHPLCYSPSNYTYGSIYGVTIPNNLESTLLQSQDNLFSFYFRAFEVDENAQECLNLSTAFVVLIYNLGLSMLFEVASRGAIGRNELNTIIHMFQTAMRAANVLWDQGGFDDELLCLALGITNNLGYLHCLAQDPKQARDHLVLAVDLVAHPAAEDAIPLEDYEFFYHSTCMFSSGVHLNAAPAA